MNIDSSKHPFKRIDLFGFQAHPNKCRNTHFSNMVPDFSFTKLPMVLAFSLWVIR
jgi:hypothetical protein